MNYIMRFIIKHVCLICVIIILFVYVCLYKNNETMQNNNNIINKIQPSSNKNITQMKKCARQTFITVNSTYSPIHMIGSMWGCWCDRPQGQDYMF